MANFASYLGGSSQFYPARGNQSAYNGPMTRQQAAANFAQPASQNLFYGASLPSMPSPFASGNILSDNSSAVSAFFNNSSSTANLNNYAADPFASAPNSSSILQGAYSTLKSYGYNNNGTPMTSNAYGSAPTSYNTMPSVSVYGSYAPQQQAVGPSSFLNNYPQITGGYGIPANTPTNFNSAFGPTFTPGSQAYDPTPYISNVPLGAYYPSNGFSDGFNPLAGNYYDNNSTSSNPYGSDPYSGIATYTGGSRNTSASSMLSGLSDNGNGLGSLLQQLLSGQS